jgi:hypothetical protein
VAAVDSDDSDAIVIRGSRQGATAPDRSAAPALRLAPPEIHDVAIPEEKRLARSSPERAAALLDRMVDGEQGTLTRDPADGCRWVSPRFRATEILGRAPSATLAAWRDRCETPGASALEAAERSRSPDELIAVADRYPATRFEVPALARAADLLVEGGSLAAATEALERASASTRARGAEGPELRSRLTRLRELEALSGPHGSPAGSLARTWQRPATPFGRDKVPVSIRASASALFVHDGAGVSALDPATGQLLWETLLDHDGLPGGRSGLELSERLVAVRDGRRALVLDPATGSIELACELGRDLGHREEHDGIVAAVWACSRLFVLVLVGPEYQLAVVDSRGKVVATTELWEAPPDSPPAVALRADAAGCLLAADRAIASCDLQGRLRWVRVLEATGFVPDAEYRLTRSADRVLLGYGARLDVASAHDGTVVKLPLVQAPHVAATPARQGSWLAFLSDRDLHVVDAATGRELGRVATAGLSGPCELAFERVFASGSASVAAFAFGGAPAPGVRATARAPSIDALVAGLGSPDAASRLAAATALEELGAQALPALGSAERAASVELATAARKTRARIELRAAFDRAFPGIRASELLAALGAPGGPEGLERLGSPPFVFEHVGGDPGPLLEWLERQVTSGPLPRRRLATLVTLARVRPEAREKLAAIAVGPGAYGPEARAGAAARLVEAARASRDGRALDRLRAAVSDGRPDVRWAARRALLRAGLLTDMPELFLIPDRGVVAAEEREISVILERGGVAPGSPETEVTDLDRELLAAWSARP